MASSFGYFRGEVPDCGEGVTAKTSKRERATQGFLVLPKFFAANGIPQVLDRKLNEPAVDGLQGSAAPAKDADPLAGTAVVGVALDGFHPVPDDA